MQVTSLKTYNVPKALHAFPFSLYNNPTRWAVVFAISPIRNLRLRESHTAKSG